MPILTVILLGWGIALFEYYLFQVPANRIGHRVPSAAEPKTIQEVITLTVFALFPVCYLGEPLHRKHAVGLSLIAAGAGIIFLAGSRDCGIPACSATGCTAPRRPDARAGR